MDSDQEMVDFLKRERVDVIISCDMSRGEMVGLVSSRTFRPTISDRDFRVVRADVSRRRRLMLQREEQG